MHNTNQAPAPPPPVHEPHVGVSLDNLIHNLHEVRARLPARTDIMAVVKDGAYGCGAIPVSRALERAGVGFFAVARAGEARALRTALIQSPVLVLGGAPDEDLAWGATTGIHFALDDIPTLGRWGRCGHPITFHCEIDTGMGRLGLHPGDTDALISALRRYPALTCAGVFTHFACADDPNPDSVRQQLQTFRRVLDTLHQAGIHPVHVHCANSAAIIRHHIDGFTHARPGIALYGCRPDPAQDFGVDLKPVLSLKSHVIHLKRVPAGTHISYGWHYTAAQETVIATVAAGYACGVPRLLSGKGSVLINGTRFPIAGNVTMDYIMADVGPAASVAVGDEAVLMGAQGGEIITADEIALMSGTIGYEVLCGIGTAMHRYCTLDGKPFSYQPPVYF